MAKRPKIGIVGLGMVGTPLRKHLENNGFKRGINLFCYDIDPKKGFFDDIGKADIVFVSVPTLRRSDGSCDTRIIESVVKQFYNKNKVLVIKSTVEPGTVSRLEKKYNCRILFSPEFLTESRSWEDFMKPDRQIVSHASKSTVKTGEILKFLPKALPFSAKISVFNSDDLRSTEAEMGKYACNVFGAMKVVFSNIIADFCRAAEMALQKDGIKEKVDYENVKKVIAYDRRIGGSWLNVNYGNYRGFGGFCFPKDTDAFIFFAKKIEKKLSSANKEEKKLKILVRRGIDFLESMRDYNKELLKTQNLTIKDVSSHDEELAKKLKKLKTKKDL